jgi:lauroyl/myristoyl acyltransferase
VLRKLRWLCAYYISRAGARIGPLLPARVWYALALPLSYVCFALMPRYRRVVVDNLARVVGQDAATAAGRRVFLNFARYVVDLYQMPALGRDTLMKRIDFTDWARLNEALDEGNGSLFVTLHLGQMDVGAAGMVASGHPVNVVAEPLGYEPMNELIQEFRRRLGISVIPANKATSSVMRCLHRGEVLAMMFDGVDKGDCVPVQFFGETFQAPTAAARIALRTGSRILPAVLARDPKDPRRIMPVVDYGVRLEPTGDDEADVRRITQAVATAFEAFVRRFADQWLAFHPVWSAEVEKRPDSQPEVKAAPKWKEWSLVAAIRLGTLLPRNVSYGLAKVMGDLAYTFRKGARWDVHDNMRHVLGQNASPEDLRRYGRDAFRNVARYYADLVRLPVTTPKELLEQRVKLRGYEHLTRVLNSGRGVIVGTAHYGNPEIAVQVAGVLGLDVLVLAEPLQPPSFAAHMERIRAAFGTKYIDVGFGAIADCIRHVRKGGVLAIAADRDIQGKGVPVEFFGEKARVPLGAADLAQRTGAALIPAYCKRLGDGFEVVFEAPLELVNTGHSKDDALTNTRALFDRFEAWLRADPGQWMVLDRIWKPLPAGDKAPEARVEAESLS